MFISATINALDDHVWLPEALLASRALSVKRTPVSTIITHDCTHTSFYLAAATCTLHFFPSPKTPLLVIMIKSFDLPPLGTLCILMTRLVGYHVNLRSFTVQPLIFILPPKYNFGFSRSRSSITEAQAKGSSYSQDPKTLFQRM